MRRLSIWDGTRAFFGGMGFVVSRPRLWPYAAVPVLVLVALGTGLSVLALYLSWHFVSALVGGASAWAEAGRWLLEVLVGGVLVVIAILAAFGLAQPLSGFALEAISERQELELGGARRDKPGFWANARRSLAVNMMGLVVGLPLFAILTLVELFVPPAAVVTVPLKFVVSALLLAWDLLDYPLGLRGEGVRARLAFFQRNFGALLAFGSLGAAVLVVPGLGLLLLPFGVAGATRLVTWAELPA